MVKRTQLNVTLHEGTLRVMLEAAEALLPPTVSSRKPGTSVKAPKVTSKPENDKLHPHTFTNYYIPQAPLTGTYL
jgi:hypothetical protein